MSDTDTTFNFILAMVQSQLIPIQIKCDGSADCNFAANSNIAT